MGRFAVRDRVRVVADVAEAGRGNLEGHSRTVGYEMNGSQVQVFIGASLMVSITNDRGKYHAKCEFSRESEGPEESVI